MNAYEKAYRQLAAHGFCHFSTRELDQYLRKARRRVFLAVGVLAAAVLAYVYVIRPM